MRIDKGSLLFNRNNGECPSWETALGQSTPSGELPTHYFSEGIGYENILCGMIYSAIPLNDVSCVLGKGGKFVTALESSKNEKNQEIQLAAKFDKVYLHFYSSPEVYQAKSPFILLIVKIQDPQKDHFGRRSIKFSPHTKAEDIENKTFFEEVEKYCKGKSLLCYGIEIKFFSQLHLYCCYTKDATNWKSLPMPKEAEYVQPKPTTSNLVSNDTFLDSWKQIIYYGVPGCGKSHTITKMLEDEKLKDSSFSEENQVVRVTFHPEYTNADFIGQVMPEVINGDVKYKFKSGPFSVILKKALLNPSKKHYLVIEEINRGNAAAIFGDVFQLLDRLKEGGTSKTQVGSDGFNNHYGKGWSEYFVMNSDVNAFIRGVDESQELDTKAIDVSGVHFSSNTGLRLPPNLSIYATMNTSDQNVFTLDNAFQRRWEMKLIDNSCKWDDNDHKNQALAEIRETGICWEAFRDTINKKIAEAKVFNADDKQLGLFFMEAEGDGANKKIDQAKFANKVLKYLWTDVFKRDRDGDGIFLAKNMSDLVNNFNESNAFEKTFKKEFVDELKKWTAPFQTPVETPIVNDKSQSA